MTGSGRSSKTIIAQGKIKWKKKNHARQLTLKNIHAMALKKIHSWKSLTKKNSCGSKIPHPSHNFSNSLNQVWLSNDKTVRVPLVNQITRYSMNSNCTELVLVAHKYRTSCRRGSPRRFCSLNMSQPHSWIFHFRLWGFQSSFSTSIWGLLTRVVMRG